MKQLPPANSNFQWNTALVSQLQFIKKHLRYPIRRTIVLRFTSFLGILPMILWFGLRPLLFKSEGASYKALWPLLLMALLLGTLAVIGIYRFSQTLKFVAVKNNLGLNQNIRLLKEFLTQNHFAHSQHPEAPEIFQMLSRNIGGKEEAREVVIFIAGEDRILVNSHFTGTRKLSPVGLPHYKEMARMLHKWLVAQPAATSELQRL